MTATMSHASRGTLQKVKDKATDPEFYIKAGCVTIFGGMAVLDLGLGILLIIFAMGPLDVLIGLICLGGAAFFGGMLVETLTEW